MMTRTVYLAGPQVFLPEPVAAAAILKHICRRHGLDGVFPLNAGLDLAGMTKPDAALAIKRANAALIRGCAGVLADITPFRGSAMDVGTAWEIGHAEALGKPVVLYSGDRRSHLDRVCAERATTVDADGVVRDAQGMAVEDFEQPENLMIAAGTVVCDSFEDAVAAFAMGLVDSCRAS